jgi:phage tail protein X
MNRYQNIPTEIINKKPVYRTVKYPEIPLDENDTYVTTVQGDRFDILALQYYQDESLWWIISIANDSLSQNSLIIPEGIQLRIPANLPQILNNYNILNS